MRRLMRAEFRRLATTPLWRWGALAAVVCGAGLVGLAAMVGPANFDPPMPGVDTEAGVRAVLSLAGLAVIVPAMFGATAVTSEYRHGTITSTFLFAPRRYDALAAKLSAYAVAGAAFGLIVGLSAALGLYAGALVNGVQVGAGPLTVAVLLLRIVAVMTAYTMLGVGIGALVRNQTVTLVCLGLYLYAVEYALALVPGVNQLYPYLPGGATAALTQLTLITDAAGQVGVPVGLLTPALGALVLTAYALAATALAVVFPVRRDVT